ncbi:hypothetical protein JQX09_24580 [Sulfitobacter pseudonitzschiae]|uniref:Uncharacterized protein n=1 Tax=Pseudosulfitobacter pseudonitzschiae TaxID=1402135 RepID=A0A9Q2NRL4_9RHOB|nr:hypothetical protein [Pseudosulfitobacter pseudonitzschiae]MBM2295096.1 hypothetical protein [Pseudosulfitobacter pseudonitzschiae]MBM2300033.1 hypothetical protein [Pseudosulfitobacter pseudonitzschiae]MBM2304934.1 hypothetical protein [Pseudosulfitobacter pseudonitzschiae]MBM2314707.1 hypothetical protein [Pseudosulfitobacter pseudonitzschiae]MBM2319615.1 hypothetical protein [Pseudosulfitobacter pseudonitzschiae]
MIDIKIIESPLSQSVAVEGHRFEIQIYRGEDTLWTLEVVNEKSTSFVWDELFPTDRDALGAALADFENSPVEDFLD